MEEFGSVSSLEPDRARALAIARDGCILRGLVGSTAHGLGNPSTDDRDELGVCIEPPEYVLGLRRFEHCVARTQKEGKTSGPGDLDLTIYGLRKFCTLAIKGSPTILLLLFVEGEFLLEWTSLGLELQTLAPSLVSKRTGRAFLGYMDSQTQSLNGGARARERSAEHGYDTKYAMHALRIGHQGLEILRTGRISLPVGEPTRSRLAAVRAGSVPLRDVLAEIDDLEARLKAAIESSELPPEPDLDAIDAFLRRAYLSSWG